MKCSGLSYDKIANMRILLRFRDAIVVELLTHCHAMMMMRRRRAMKKKTTMIMAVWPQ